jgi:hypothetical protein
MVERDEQVTDDFQREWQPYHGRRRATLCGPCADYVSCCVEGVDKLNKVVT